MTQCSLWSQHSPSSASAPTPGAVRFQALGDSVPGVESDCEADSLHGGGGVSVRAGLAQTQTPAGPGGSCRSIRAAPGPGHRVGRRTQGPEPRPFQPAPFAETMGLGGPAASCPASAPPSPGTWALAPPSHELGPVASGCRSQAVGFAVGRAPESPPGASCRGGEPPSLSSLALCSLRHRSHLHRPADRHRWSPGAGRHRLRELPRGTVGGQKRPVRAKGQCPGGGGTFLLGAPLPGCGVPTAVGNL